jgi:hypothetical protein
MSLRRAMCVAAFLLPAAVAPAAAQFAPGPPQQQQTPPPCIQEFLRLRDDASKKAGFIRAASEHKVSAKVACGLFNTFVASELKMIKYAETNATSCGIPPQIVQDLKKSHAQATQIRNKVCSAATASDGPQMAPRPPNLSDTLGGAIPDPNNIKTGRGTFDTLTGSPLGNK